MSTKQTEALKLALEALWEYCTPYQDGTHPADQAITAIREALAEQPAQQRPQNCGTGYCSCIECLFEPEHQEPVAYAVYHRMGGSKSLHWPEQHSPDGDANQYQLVPLYTSQQPAQQQEPVAKVDYKQRDGFRWLNYLGWQRIPDGASLYTSPPASKPKNVMRVKRISDQSVELVFTSCAAASEFEAKLREKNA